MKIIATTILFLNTVGYLFAQNPTIEQLRIRFQSETDLGDKSGGAADLAWEFLYLNSDSTLHYARESLKYARIAGDSTRLATAYGTLGLYYDVNGLYRESAQAYLKAIRVLEKLEGKYYELAANYSNLALVFGYIGDHRRSLHYHFRGLHYELKTSNVDGAIYSYINIANVYQRLGMLDSALYYHRYLFDLGQREKSEAYKVDLASLTDLYLEMNQLDSAEKYAQLHMDFARSNQTNRRQMLLADAFKMTGRVHLKKGNAQQAVALFDTALTIAKNHNHLNLQASLHYALADALESLNQSPAALRHLRRAQALSDSLRTDKLQAEIERLQALFESEQKENTIHQLSADKALSALALEKSENRQTTLLLISAVVLLLLGLTAYFLRNSVLNSRKLQKQKHLIENLMRESHHRIKNNLQMISSLLSMQSRKAMDCDAKKALDEAHKRVQTIALLHQKLQYGEAFNHVKLDDFLEDLAVSMAQSANLDIDRQLHLYLDPCQLENDKAIAIGLILNEWMSNSLKHAHSNLDDLEIHIELRQADQLSLRYRDNGGGYTVEEVQGKQTLGSTIVQVLAQDLEADIRLAHDRKIDYALSL